MTRLLQEISSGTPAEIAVQEQLGLEPEDAAAVVRHAVLYLRHFDRLAMVLAGLAPQALIDEIARESWLREEEEG